MDRMKGTEAGADIGRSPRREHPLGKSHPVAGAVPGAGGKDTFQKEKLQENQDILAWHSACTTCCKHKDLSPHTSLPPPGRVLGKNSCQSESLLSWSELFCCKAQTVLQEFVESLQRSAEQSQAVAAYRDMLSGSTGATRGRGSSAAHGGAAPQILSAPWGWVTVVCWLTPQTPFSASYHCEQAARWFMKRNCPPPLTGRSPCRYQGQKQGILLTTCWLCSSALPWPPRSFSWLLCHAGFAEPPARS